MRLTKSLDLTGRLCPDYRSEFGQTEPEVVEAFCRRVLRIKTKKHGAQPFAFNAEQRELHEGLSGYDLIVKPRQIGVTTYFVGRHLTRAIFYENVRVGIAFHKEDSAQAAARDILQYMYRSIPSRIRPAVHSDKQTQLFFPLWHSSVEILWLGGSGSGRSGTFTDLSVSEAAFLTADAAGLTESVSGALSIESTGDDPSGAFFDAVKAAQRGESKARLHFFSWLAHPQDYSIEKGAPLGKLDREEQRLRDQRGATDGQLRWRRDKLSRFPFVGNPVRFRREYPDSIDDAFAFAGNKWFRVEHVEKRRAVVEASQIQPVDERPAYGLKVWEKPIESHNYVIGADIAEGASRAASSACVIDCTTSPMRQVAELHSTWIETPDFASALNELGLWYGGAKLAPETNNMGHAVVNDLLNLYDYPDLYEQKAYTQPDRPGSMLDPYASRPWGWTTNVRTRALLFSAVTRELTHPSVIIRSLPLMDDIAATLREGGKPKPGPGTFGDRLIAFAIALYVISESPELMADEIEASDAGQSTAPASQETAAPVTFLGLHDRRF